jgi:ABC-2 type transport system ATP-binding protein
MGDRNGDLAMDLRHVAKTYRRRVHALKGIALQVHRGEVFGLLGPNGAGKSTLVKIMMTVVRPTRAQGTVLGRPVGHRSTLARLGYLPESPRFPPYLTGRQTVEFYGAMAKVDRRARRRRSLELLELVGLKDWINARVGTYSKGMQQRLGLAQALVSDPDLVVFDEPTDGLDPVGRRDTRELLRRLRAQGTTVFVNSHLLSEVEEVCDRVAILVGGRVVHQGTIDDLTARTQYYEIRLAGEPTPDMRRSIREALGCGPPETEEPATPILLDATGPAPSAVDKGTLPSGETFERTGGTLRLSISRAEAVQPIIDALRRRDLVIESVRPVRQSLEDFFIATVAGSEGDVPSIQRRAKGVRP